MLLPLPPEPCLRVNRVVHPPLVHRLPMLRPQELDTVTMIRAILRAIVEDRTLTRHLLDEAAQIHMDPVEHLPPVMEEAATTLHRTVMALAMVDAMADMMVDVKADETLPVVDMARIVARDLRMEATDHRMEAKDPPMETIDLRTEETATALRRLLEDSRRVCFFLVDIVFLFYLLLRD